MINAIPTISITQDESIHMPDELNEDDFKYDITGTHTDVEDLDSDDDSDNSRCPSRMLKIRRKSAPRRMSDAGTDIENYNDSDSDSDEKSEPERDPISLNEFLDHGFVEEVSSHAIGRLSGMKESRSTFKSYLGAPIDDDAGITDCENVETSDDEAENKAPIDDKRYNNILKDMLIDDGNTIKIHDARSKGRREHSASVSPLSFVTDSSDSDGERGPWKTKYNYSDVENIIFSDDGSSNFRQPIRHSRSALEAEEIVLESTDIEDNPIPNIPYPTIDITFPQGDRNASRQRKCRTRKFNTLAVNRNFEEAITDVENLDSSDDESNIKSSFLIPAAIARSRNEALTDVEDFEIEDDCIPSCSNDIKLPSPVREITLMREDERGDPITKVMPLNSSGTFLGVIEPYIDKGLTDTEDMSGNEEDYYSNRRHSINFNVRDLDGGIVYNSEGITSAVRTKRFDLCHVEPVTDVEEIFVGGGAVRRRKSKPKSAKPRVYLDTRQYQNARATTDVEELYVSDDQAQHFQRIKKVSKINVPPVNDGGLTDTEDISGDENDYASNPKDIDISVLNQETYYSTITSTDGSTVSTFIQKENLANKPLQKRAQPISTEMSAESEDMQFYSDSEDLLNVEICSRADTVTPIDIRNALDESASFQVFDHSNNCYDRTNEGIHIKGYREIQEAHTDVEFLEDDAQGKSKNFNKKNSFILYF